MTKLRQPQRLQRPTIATTTTTKQKNGEGKQKGTGAHAKTIVYVILHGVDDARMKVFRFTRVINSWAMPPLWLCCFVAVWSSTTERFDTTICILCGVS